MSSELMDTTLDGEEFTFEHVGDGLVLRSHKHLDARRRLEDKLEEYRLRREMKEFEFDM